MAFVPGQRVLTKFGGNRWIAAKVVKVVYTVELSNGVIADLKPEELRSIRYEILYRNSFLGFNLSKRVSNKTFCPFIKFNLTIGYFRASSLRQCNKRHAPQMRSKPRPKRTARSHFRNHARPVVVRNGKMFKFGGRWMSE